MIGSQPPGVGTYPKKILLVIGTLPEHLPSTTTKTTEHQQHERPCPNNLTATKHTRQTP